MIDWKGEKLNFFLQSFMRYLIIYIMKNEILYLVLKFIMNLYLYVYIYRERERERERERATPNVIIIVIIILVNWKYHPTKKK